MQLPIAHVYAIEQDAALLHIVETHQEVRDRSLAGAGMPDQCYGLSRRDGERNIFQDPVIFLVSKPHIFKFDATFRTALLQRAGGRGDGYRQIERLKNSM